MSEITSKIVKKIMPLNNIIICLRHP